MGIEEFKDSTYDHELTDEEKKESEARLIEELRAENIETAEVTVHAVTSVEIPITDDSMSDKRIRELAEDYAVDEPNVFTMQRSQIEADEVRR